MSETIHGACLCGKVTFDVSRPEAMGACHCTRCQRWTGSSNTMVVVADPADLKITAGKELLKQYHEEGFADRYFCSNCGSAIYVHGGKRVFVGAGGMKDLKLKPSFHIQVAYKAPWEEIGGSAPQFAEWPKA